MDSQMPTSVDKPLTHTPDEIEENVAQVRSELEIGGESRLSLSPEDDSGMSNIKRGNRMEEANTASLKNRSNSSTGQISFDQDHSSSSTLHQAQDTHGQHQRPQQQSSHRRSGSGTYGSQVVLRDPMEAPVRKLSVNLIRTYKYINQVYYENKRKRQQLEASSSVASSNAQGTDVASASGKNQPQQKSSSSSSSSSSSASSVSSTGLGASVSSAVSGSRRRTYNNGYDDENSDYIIRIGERLNGRYVVKQKIGKGSFGQVVRATDEISNENVAIKIIKSRRPFFLQAKTEIALLNELNEKDPDDKWFIVRLLDTFVHHNHQCLVFEMLSYNLYDLLRNTQFYGVSLNLIRKFARQILKALYFLAREDVDIVHSDLKPENLLLRHPKRSAIKVIDFGSSCKSDNQMYSYIQSRFYRSPEVILGRRYSVAIDMWSLGCILVEMHTGEPLFSGSDEHDQIIRLVAVRGMPPEQILDSASKTKQFFELKSEEEIEQENSTSPFFGSRWKLLSRKKGDPVETELARHKRTLPQILGLIGTSGPAARRSTESGHSRQMYDLFIDLVEKMLEYDPEKRIDPKTALNHPFVLSDSQNIVMHPLHRHHQQQSLAGIVNPIQPSGISPSEVDGLISSSSEVTSSSYLARRPGSAPAAAAGICSGNTVSSSLFEHTLGLDAQNKEEPTQYHYGADHHSDTHRRTPQGKRRSNVGQPGDQGDSISSSSSRNN